MWGEIKTDCQNFMAEVAEFFAGNRNWNGEHKDDDLAEYF